MYTIEKLKELQALSLADKIVISKLRITEFYEHYDGNIVVSFSGGEGQHCASVPCQDSVP